MWKERYRIGVELIDRQHRELFRRVERLLVAIEQDKFDEQRRQDCLDAIAFLKEYVVMHFSQEEEYQRSIGFLGAEAHKRMHEEFAASVGVYERRFAEAPCSLALVRDFAGMLVAWLIYHIASADQQMAGEEVPRCFPAGEAWDDSLHIAAVDMLCRISGLSADEVTLAPLPAEGVDADILVMIDFTGEGIGGLCFGADEDFAAGLVQSMTQRVLAASYDMEGAAMAELCHGIAKSTAVRLGRGRRGYKLSLPVVQRGPARVGPGPGLRLKALGGRLDIALLGPED